MVQASLFPLAVLEALIQGGQVPRECGMGSAAIDYEFLEDADISQPTEMQEKYNKQSTPPPPVQELGVILCWLVVKLQLNQE